MEQITVILIAQIVVVGVTGARYCICQVVELNRSGNCAGVIGSTPKAGSDSSYMDSATSCANGRQNVSHIHQTAALVPVRFKERIG
jgi:hypothetical protein